MCDASAVIDHCIDVFLSPLKPPTKASISIEAIQSSLYYFHVNTENDEEVKQSVEQQRHSEELNRPPIAVTRKPVPASPLSNHPLPPLPEANDHDGYLFSCPPGSSNQENRRNNCEQLRLDTSLEGGSKRKPVSFTAHNLYQPTGDYTPSPANKSLHPTREEHHLHEVSEQGHQGNVTAVSGASVAPNKVFGLVTIIRRDPASGSQWNIGTMSLLQSTFAGSNIKPIRVELTTPGYGRFAKGLGYETPRPGSAGSTAVSLKRAIQDMTFSPASATSPITPGMPFTRVVDFRRMAMSDLKRTAFKRTNSTDSIGMSNGKSAVEKNVLAFDSPWNGTCCFVNAIDGKSLKIRHSISSNSSTMDGITASLGELRFNLGWSVLSNVKDARIKKKETEPDKLPIPKLIESKKENFRKSFQNFRNKSRESFQRLKQDRDEEYLRDISNIETPTTNNLVNQQVWTSSVVTAENDTDEEHRISLKLGRERAGGGFRGHSAKLGKLIIEDEGLKMCDLVVAAAMGVWWQHYDS